MVKSTSALAIFYGLNRFGKTIRITIKNDNQIMLEYTKSLLLKVSFDKNLFTKELAKSLKWLNSDDKMKLKYWSLLIFHPLYEKEIVEIFHSLV